VRLDWDPAKERANRRKHGLDFSFAALILADPLALTVFDRVDQGEERWHTLGRVGGKVLLLVHAFPDPGDEAWVRVIGLREATARERKFYEEGDTPG